MQMVGGIGHINVLPLERICRDIRLASIWKARARLRADAADEIIYE
jgi:alkylation response protein AidB-like acyl-CoA dehydrogenase